MDSQIIEVAVVGAGPAGLQAALSLGRVHIDTVVLDSGSYRNDPTAAVHNVLTLDGTPPAELRREVRGELAQYPSVTVLDQAVQGVVDDTAGDGPASFLLTTADGLVIRARAVVLATGARDVLPDIDGLADVFGREVAHCPFCHGHEFSGGRVAVLGDAIAHHGPFLRRIASDLLALPSGGAMPEQARDLPRRDEPVTAVVRTDTGLRIDFASGPAEIVDGLFVPTVLTQAAPFAGQLGLGLNDSGAVRVDARGHTSRRGVYAAGDMAHTPDLPMAMATVPQAIATGAMAGGTAAAEIAHGLLG